MVFGISFSISVELFQEKPLFPPKFRSMVVFVSIKVHFQYVFINKPFCYSDGIHHVFENIDFAGMTYKEFVGFLERFTQEKCEKVYCYQLDLEIPEGLTMISSDYEYQECIDVTHRCGVQLPMYMCHTPSRGRTCRKCD
ncbi:unnamed protein product [Lactuca saligna]|uniref:Uncharacterized protein n=1 Tax=Lactuca saligna TaxID=75948 RepID=A0AA36E979_LACSI|nr:unnamed protein product [Lactuca saligna]